MPAVPPEHARFKPGQSGNMSGRPKKLLSRVDEILVKAGIHPLTKLLELLPELRPREQAQFWLEILAYCQAKPKFLDEDREALDNLKKLSNEELLKIVKETHPELSKVAG